MKLFGFEISRIKQATEKALSPVMSRGTGGWWPLILESRPGAWQQNSPIMVNDALSYWAVFRCVSIISSDIAKMRLRLMEQDSDSVWTEIDSPAFSPVLRKPNEFQTPSQFFANWMESKLTRGNTYVLKQRDGRGVVVALYVLDPMRVTTLVSDTNKAVFYELQQDNISGIRQPITIPASEIIHDRWNTHYHPLVGLSPIFANGIAAIMGLRIQNSSSGFFNNGARPSGIIFAPGPITDQHAQELKTYWETNYSGDNAGRIAVLGDGLKFEQVTMSAVDAQLIEQLKWTDAIICGAFGVPAYMLNAGPPPSFDNVEALTQQYYQQCLQIHVKAIEACMDFGLGLAPEDGFVRADGKTLSVQFDLDDLLRMDTATKVSTAAEGLKGIFTPNEARKKFDLKPKAGGDAVYLQQQNFSIEALNKRDTKEDPFNPAISEPAATNDDDVTDEEIDASAQLAAWELKSQLMSLAA